MSLATNIGTNIVPNGASRKAVTASGIVYRFGFVRIEGTNMCKCTEVLYTRVPDVSVIEDLFKKYEGVTPHDYRLRWYDSNPQS